MTAIDINLKYLIIKSQLIKENQLTKKQYKETVVRLKNTIEDPWKEILDITTTYRPELLKSIKLLNLLN